MEKTYRTAIVGGRRGLYHAQAYKDLENMEVVAICEVDDQRRAYAEVKLNVTGYADYEQMLEREQPDIVHAVTNPRTPRHIWIEPAVQLGVSALVIEKPIALRPEEAKHLDSAKEGTNIKVIVNHQRRYMPFADKMREFQSEGKLGEVHFIRASTQGAIMNMDTHLMDLVLLIAGDVPPTHVWATIEGGQTYKNKSLKCPDDMIAVYTFPNGIRVFFESTRKPLGVADFPGSNAKCNIDVWATKGRMWWRENGSWGYVLDGVAPEQFIEPTSFVQDDVIAQRRLTQAIATWLSDESKSHYCRYEIAKIGFESIMAAYRSALKEQRVSIPPYLQDKEWEQLRIKLTSMDKSCNI